MDIDAFLVGFGSLVVAILGIFYTRRMVKSRDLQDKAVNEIGNVVQGLEWWTSPNFFSFYVELQIATINVIRELYDKKLTSLRLKIRPYMLEMYTWDRTNPRKESMHFEFTSESKFDKFLTAFRMGEPTAARLYLQSEPPGLFPTSIELNCIWGLSELERFGLSNLPKYQKLIDPLDPEILNLLNKVVHDLLQEVFSSMQPNFTEVEINSSMPSKEIHELLYGAIVDRQSINSTLELVREVTGRLRKVQKGLFMKP